MPRPKKVDERGERILDATERLVAERGYELVRLMDVADAADVSIGSIQHRFRSREGMIRAALERANDREQAVWIDLVSGVTEPWERLLALLRNAIQISSDSQPDRLWLQVIAAAQTHPELRSLQQSQQDSWTQTFQRAVEDVLASGRMTSVLNAEEAGLALLALIDGFFIARNIGDSPPDLDQVATIVERVAHLVFEIHDVEGAE